MTEALFAVSCLGVDVSSTTLPYFSFATAQHDCAYLCRYSLEWHVDSDSCFDIDTVEGTISTNDYLDRETALQHNITVLATKVSKYPGRKASSLEKGLLSSYRTHSDYK